MKIIRVKNTHGDWEWIVLQHIQKIREKHNEAIIHFDKELIVAVTLDILYKEVLPQILKLRQNQLEE
jgi:hypothetical protein